MESVLANLERCRAGLDTGFGWVARALDDPAVTAVLQGRSILTVPSYEERSFLSLERVSALVGHPAACTMLHFPDYSEPPRSLFLDPDEETARAYRDHRARMCRFLEKAGVPLREVSSGLKAPSAGVGQLELPAGSIVDISCFPRSHLLQLLRLPWVRQCPLVYSRVGYYEQDESNFAVGVEDLACVEGYEGEVRNRPTILCLALGFEGCRAMAVFRKYDPYRTLAFVVNTDDPDVAAVARRNNYQLLANATVEEHAVEGLDPHGFAVGMCEALRSFLVREKARRHDFDLVASFLGPKPQVLGARLMVDAGLPVHVVYAVPTKRRICSHGIGETCVMIPHQGWAPSGATMAS